MLVYAALVLDNVLLTVVGDKDLKQWVKLINHGEKRSSIFKVL